MALPEVSKYAMLARLINMSTLFCSCAISFIRRTYSGVWKHAVYMYYTGCLFQLHIAAANGYIQVTEFLLSHGVSVDSVDSDSWQPIHCATCWGQVCSFRRCSNTNSNNRRGSYVASWIQRTYCPQTCIYRMRRCWSVEPQPRTARPFHFLITLYLYTWLSYYDRQWYWIFTCAKKPPMAKILCLQRAWPLRGSW